MQRKEYIFEETKVNVLWTELCTEIFEPGFSDFTFGLIKGGKTKLWKYRIDNKQAN